jgi:hypothetical protein
MLVLVSIGFFISSVLILIIQDKRDSRPYASIGERMIMGFIRASTFPPIRSRGKYQTLPVLGVAPRPR